MNTILSKLSSLIFILLVSCSSPTPLTPTNSPETPTTQPKEISTSPPEPTSTPTIQVSPTPTEISRSTIIVYLNELLPGHEIIAIHDFNTLPPISEASGVNYRTPGFIGLFSSSDWRKLTNSQIRTVVEEQAIVIRFRYDPSSNIRVFFQSQTVSGRLLRWGLSISAFPKTYVRYGEVDFGGANFGGDYFLTADTWYDLILSLQEGGKFSATIFHPESKTRMTSFESQYPDEWKGLEWEIDIRVRSGGLYLDEFVLVNVGK